jgi:hypothetical protein
MGTRLCHVPMRLACELFTKPSNLVHFSTFDETINPEWFYCYAVVKE